MHSNLQPIGIFGGTFDPIHFGHLRCALELSQALNLAEVRMIPCFQPVHRKLPVANPLQRLAMVKKAITGEPAFRADDCEIKRAGPSYMIETLLELRKLLPDTPFCLIMGIDALLGFTSWHRWEEILQQAHLVVAHRPQYQLPKTGTIANLLKERLVQSAECLNETLSGHIIFHPITALEISASDIRKQFATGKNPRYLLPDNVFDYIQEHGVYNFYSDIIK